MDFIRKKLIKNKKGQSAIELAIIFPILAMLIQIVLVNSFLIDY